MRRAAFTLHGAMLRAAEEHPDGLAVSTSDAEVSYRELERRSARVAAALVALGVEPGDRVAVSAEKSVDTVTALYGIMRAGAAYVPIDPHSPPVRAAHVLGDAGCRVLCADAPRAARLTGALEEADRPPVLALGDAAVSGAAITTAELAGIDPDHRTRGCEDDLAYILYTSGSTGAPKGVMLTHRNALAFAEWAVDRFGVVPEDRLASHAPFHFDLSVFDLYGAAVAAASVHVLSPAHTALGPEMAAAIERQRLTVWYSVPSALVLLCDTAQPDQVACLRVILFAGEVFPMKHLRRLRALVPHALLANLYGPTETNVCTYHVVDHVLPDDDTPLPIGRACENQEVFALNEHLRMVAEGEVGELWARGPTVMKGYWGDKERTSRSLRQNPLHDAFPDPAYCTGDVVRRLPGDVYEFLGRRDHQIKSRGYRIELGEIETALVAHPAIREAAIVPVPDERIGNTLIAFVAASDAVDELELKRHCATRLPRYMIPARVVVDKELPHTSTGKIDRQALARVVAPATAEAPA